MKETNTDVEVGVQGVVLQVDSAVNGKINTSPASTQQGSDENKENGEKVELLSTTPSLTKVLGMAKPEIPMLVLAFFFLLGGEASNLVIPMILARAYDELIFNYESPDVMTNVNVTMAIVIGIYVGGAILSFLRVTIQGVIGERLVARLRCKLYASMLKQEIAFFDQHKSGELVSRLGSDTTLLQNAISLSIPEVLTGVIKSITALALMFIISAKLAGLSVSGVLFIAVLCVPLGKALGRLSKDYQDVLGDAQTHSTEALGSMRTVQSFAAERKESVRYESKIGNPDQYPLWWPFNHKENRTTYSIGFFKSLVNSGFFSLMFGGGFGFLNLCLWYGFYLVYKGELTIGEMTAFQTYFFNVGFGLAQAGGNAAKYFEALGASGRVFYLVERIPKIPKQDDTRTEVKEKGASIEKRKLVKKPTTIEGAIEFQNVNFSYPTRPGINVLEDFTLKIPRCTTTALVGSSGAGKSTVVSLLQRFYDIDTGSISIDGNNITDLDLQWLRSKIGYVQQEPQLFGFSIRENLLYGVTRKVSQDELEQACKDANAHEFISKFVNGYDTSVGERGVKLSGGQKQRVAIARALLTNCSILLLDEATSALDSQSEHLVQQAIDKAVVGRTVIIVAHRLSTIRGADQIVVIDNHKIVSVGSHEELLKTSEKYQDLIKRQNMK